ncbi:MAG: hypothetical protein ACREJO_18295, partial [Phycisphaerales bacterium]
ALLELGILVLAAAGTTSALTLRPQAPAAAVTRDEQDDDQVVTLDRVPAAVRATILQHAAGKPIAEIELGTENGVRVYEIDCGSKEFKVGVDGAFLGNEPQDNDDDDGDDDGEQDDD